MNTNTNTNNNMQCLETWFETSSIKVAKVGNPISFEIANEAGVAITKEGPVAYEADHYLVSNGLSPAYPVAPSTFNALYDISLEQEGVATPKAIEKYSKLATEDGSITTSWGVLAYRNGLDYIVRHAANDYGVVDDTVFNVTYNIIDRSQIQPREEDEFISDHDETTNGLRKFCNAESSYNSSMYGGGVAVVVMPIVMMVVMMVMMVMMANSL
jgi:hypothetical protein